MQSLSLTVLDEETIVPVLPEGAPFCQAVRVREGAQVQIIAEARNGAGGTSQQTVTVRLDLNEPTVCITRNGQCLQSAQRP